MLGTKTKTTTEKNAPSANGIKDSSDTCVISSGTSIEGKFNSSENVRLDGFIKGNVQCSQRLVMGESGKIEGNVQTKDAIIMGRIDGELHVNGSLHLKGTARINGIIHAKLMMVDEGACYVGECKIGG
jgi:cytoskeletal protein CcmA (bactofilin family)